MADGVGRRQVLTGLALAAAAPAQAEWLRNELVVYTEPELRPVLQAVARGSRPRLPGEVIVFGGAGMQLVALIAHKTQDDVIVARRDALDAAQAQGLLRSAPVDLWRNRLVFVAREAGPTVPFDAGILRARGLLASPDATAACPVDGPAILGKLGLGGAPTVGAATTRDAVDAVMRGEAELALCHVSEQAALCPKCWAMQVPDEAYPPIRYAAGMPHTAWSRGQEEFLAFLSSPEALGEARKFGLEPA